MHGDDIKRHSPHSRRPIRIGFVAASGTLAVGAVGSWIGLVNARESGNYAALPWFGFLALGLAVGSMLCLAVPLVHRIEARAARSAGTSMTLDRPTGDYVAKFSAQDQVIAVILVIFCGCLTLFMLFRSHRILGQAVSVAVFCCLIAYAVQVTATSVRFTNERIIARLPGFRTISEPYTAIESLQSKPGTIRIKFSDGRSLKLHSGLGDPDLVIGYLQARCPDSIYPEDSQRPLG
jgi:hypothetical protein